jgi:hypothetical protein
MSKINTAANEYAAASSMAFMPVQCVTSLATDYNWVVTISSRENIMSIVVSTTVTLM